MPAGIVARDGHYDAIAGLVVLDLDELAHGLGIFQHFNDPAELDEHVEPPAGEFGSRLVAPVTTQTGTETVIARALPRRSRSSLSASFPLCVAVPPG